MKKIMAISSLPSFPNLSCVPFLYSCRSTKATISLQFPLQALQASFPLCNSSLSPRVAGKLHQHKLVFYILLILLRITTGASGVKVYEVKVPNPGIVGQPAKLECLWESGDKDFYSVRWYINNEQFYSFIRGNDPEKVNHQIPGINVDLLYSNQYIVTLSEVTRESEGQYRCELMSEAPVFMTSLSVANLSVVNLPNEPEINGFKSQYRVGETLNVTCTARNSYPEARISFHVNDKKIHHDSGRVIDLGVVKGDSRTSTTTSLLTLPLSGRHAPTLTLTCRAHILNLKEKTSVTAKVDPARKSIISFFNTGAVCRDPSSVTHLLAPLALALIFYIQW